MFVRMIYWFSDLHHDMGNRPHYPATREALPAFWRLLERDRDGIDLVVLSGDLTVRGPTDIAELRDFKRRMDDLRVPYLAVPGNHDLAPNREFAARYPGLEDYEEKPLGETHFAAIFGERGLRTIAFAGSLMLIGFAVRDGDPDDQMPWLERVLNQPGDKLVFCHYPLVPTRGEGFLKDWEYRRIGKVIPRLKELVADPAHRVLGYCCGHIHANAKTVLPGGALQVVNGASGLATVCYKRILVRDTEIVLRTERLPGFEGLYGEIMHADRSADALHPDAATYHWGLDEERDFTIARA